MRKYSCPEPICPKFGKIEKTSEKFFLRHLRKIPRSTLISLVQKLGLNINPYSENNEVLRKLLLEASVVGDDE